MLAEPSDSGGDRRREIVGDGDPFEGPADLRAERVDRLPIFRVQARQLIEPIVDRRRFGHDPPEGIRRHAEAGRHADPLDPRELPQVRSLAANDRNLRSVDLLETQHVAVRLVGVHLVASNVETVSHSTASIHSTFEVLAARPHP